MKKITIFFIVFILISSVACAQTCYTGHFAFEVPDSWNFLIYDDHIFYRTSNELFEEYLNVQEIDASFALGYSKNEILNFYKNLYGDRNDFNTFQLNNGNYACTFTDIDYDYNDTSYFYIYYENGCILYLCYTESHFSSSKESCLSELSDALITLRYSEHEKSDYQFTVKKSDNFLYSVPSGWFHISENNRDSYYGGDEVSSYNGAYMVLESPISDLGISSNLSPNEIYHSIGSLIFGYGDALSSLEEEYLEINGVPAYSCRFIMDFFDGYTYLTMVLDDENILITEFVDGKSRYNEIYSETMAKALREEIFPLSILK